MIWGVKIEVPESAQEYWVICTVSGQDNPDYGSRTTKILDILVHLWISCWSIKESHKYGMGLGKWWFDPIPTEFAESRDGAGLLQRGGEAAEEDRDLQPNAQLHGQEAQGGGHKGKAWEKIKKTNNWL